jgi:integrase
MATIDQRSPGSWRARVRLPGFAPKTRTFDTQAQAEVWAARVERELQNGHDTIPNIHAEPTLAEALDRYEREITKDKKSQAQERRRIAQWRRRALSALKLSKLSSQHFVTFRNERINAGTKRSTVRLDLALISHLFTIARKEWGMGYLTNPIADVRQLKADKWRDRRLSAAEFERFERALDSGYNRVIPINIRFALETAARKGELLKLLWRDIDLKRRVMTLRDTKNGDDRRVPLTQKAIELLEQLPRGEGERVFPITSDAITAAWRRIVVRAEIEDFRYHDLRHEATSRLFERGLEIMEVQRITGHKTLSMLLRYTQMNVDRIVTRLDATETPPTPASPRPVSAAFYPSPKHTPDVQRSKSLADLRAQALRRAPGPERTPRGTEPFRSPNAPDESDRPSNVVAFPARK